ncbi:MAG: hypothetical protein ACRC1H_13820 [Caldilineaceae bacterium]
MARNAMFEGLVFDESGRPAPVEYVGENACYIVWDGDFKRFVDAAGVDGQVLRTLRELVEGQRDMAVTAMLQMMGQDDLFTKAAVESSINNMEKAVGQPMPYEMRMQLGMMGFRIVIDESGTMVDFAMPGGASLGEGEE